MDIRMMGSHEESQRYHHVQQPLVKQNSWSSLTLDEVGNQLSVMGKSVGSMNLDELLKGAWSIETNPASSTSSGNGNTLNVSLHEQASLSLARALSEKTVDEVWRDIQEGEMRMGVRNVKVEEGSSLGEMTLEDFLVKAAVFAECLDPSRAMSPPQQFGLSHESSSRSQFDEPLGRKRDDSETVEKILERRLKRKIKNRESAARSRARKQAYQNELLTKVTQLEEKQAMLKKELEEEDVLPWEFSSEQRYQLRRTSSARF